MHLNHFFGLKHFMPCIPDIFKTFFHHFLLNIVQFATYPAFVLISHQNALIAFVWLPERYTWWPVLVVCFIQTHLECEFMEASLLTYFHSFFLFSSVSEATKWLHGILPFPFYFSLY